MFGNGSGNSQAISEIQDKDTSIRDKGWDAFKKFTDKLYGVDSNVDQGAHIAASNSNYMNCVFTAAYS